MKSAGRKAANIRRGHQLCLAIALALGIIGSQAQAIGLGAIEVKSQLGKPFVAEIPITLSTPNEADNLSVHLASSEAFARVGLDRPNDLSANLQFTVGKNARGEPVVRISTPQPMTDPYVSFLLEADWGRGKMVREYTALLDPPRTTAIRRVPIAAPVVQSTPIPVPVAPAIAAPAVSTPIVSSPAAQSATAPANLPEQPAPAPIVAVAAPPEPPAPLVAAPMEIPPPIPVPPPPAMPEPAPEPIASAPAVPEPSPPAPVVPEPTPVAAAPEAVPAPPAPEPAATPPAPAAEIAAVPKPYKSDTHTVARGETLAQIASGAHREVSLNRMMIALQRANPDAFIQQNINLLKSGSVLRIPASEEAQTLSADEANLLVQQQVESWHQTEQPSPQPSANTGEIAQPAEKAESASVASAAIPEEPKSEVIKPEPAKPATPRATRHKTAIAKAAAAKPAADTTTAPDATPSAEVAAPKPAVAHVTRAHLEIVPPAGNGARGGQTGASAGGSGSELRAELAQTKEDLATRSAEVSELKSRVSDLEKMQQDNQSLLSMKDSKLAAMEQRLAELEKNNAAAGSAASAPASAASAVPATATAVTPAANASTSSSAATTVAANPAPSDTAATKAAVAPAIETVETPWYLRPLVLIGGGLLLLGGLLSVLLRGRHRPAETAVRTNRYDTSAMAASIPVRGSADAADMPPTGQDDHDHDDTVHNEPAHDESTSPIASPAAAPVVVRRPYWTGAYDVDQQAASENTHAGSGQAVVAQAQAAPVPVPEPAAAKVADSIAPAVEHDDWGLDTPAAASAAAITKERPALDVGDQGVATKMELARAYIDIGDAEGARGMLEEVLMEGSDSQREDALKLLETLD